MLLQYERVPSSLEHRVVHHLVVKIIYAVRRNAGNRPASYAPGTTIFYLVFFIGYILPVTLQT